MEEVIDISRLDQFKESQVKVIAYEEEARNGKQSTFKDAVKFLEPGMEIVIIVGPEGGIDDTEIEVARAAGFIPVSLGKRILRTETAPIYALTAISYEHELKEEK